MATKDITDTQVCQAYDEVKSRGAANGFPYDVLMRATGQCEKVCYAAMHRAHRRGLIEYGVSLRSGWLTAEGQKLVETATESLVKNADTPQS